MEFSKCWLDYKKIDTDSISFSPEVFVKNAGIVIDTAVNEYKQAVKAFYQKDIIIYSEDTTAMPVKHEKEEGTVTLLPNRVIMRLSENDVLKEDGYKLSYQEDILTIEAKNEAGILYGTFELIRAMQKGEDIKTICNVYNPIIPIRMMNHWDNMDGSIERGYSGRSFFYKDYKLLFNERTEMYARLMASIGINAIAINNVNVHEKETYLITDTYLQDIKKYADLFTRYGIKLYISVNFAAPMELSDIPVSDPLDERVIAWWEKTVEHVYEVIPNLGGFLVKADSEGRPGPFTYGRTQADGANMLAKALKPYDGVLIWRCFVYNCGQDWRDRKTDRAKAAYDNFMDLNGSFDENVILQIKNGPMDFQVREPVSPLFGGLTKTNAMLEVQIAQEYTGQQIDVCYLIPMWKEILEFNTHAEGKDRTVLDVISGKAYSNHNVGMAGVINTGDDYNWTGNDLAAANLYGYGRLAFSPEMSAEEIAKEWIVLTFGRNQAVEKTVLNILMKSWPIYEKYTTPLGIGWMVTPHYHYGPDIDGYEYDRWGTYHRADCHGLGVDRTLNGTGYVKQYPEPLCSLYNDRNTCPEELLLFFHYVRYDEVLSSGKTLIQHIYDTHFEGVEEVEVMMAEWYQLKDFIASDIFNRVAERLKRQLENAIEWRDRVNTYFYRKSGVPDEKGRKIYS